MNGVDENKQLVDAGFSQEEIMQHQEETRQHLTAAGFSNAEVDAYYGQKPFIDQTIIDHIQENLKKASSDSQGTVRPIQSFKDAVEAGLQMSIGGLATREKTPELTSGPDTSRLNRITASAVTLGLDLPVMIAGGLIGAPGGLITSSGAAFALPMALRKILIDKYQKGEVHTFSDFWDRLSGAMVETAKGYATGAATAAVGKVAGLAVPETQPFLKSAVQTTAEYGTMVGVGSALEGKVPDANDFIDGAILILGLKGATYASKKLMQIYANAGIKPEEVQQQAQKDVTITQDLASSNIEVPKALGGSKEPPSPPISPEKVAEPPILEPPAKGSLKEAQQKILSKVSQKDTEKTMPTLDDLRTQFIDGLNPIKLAEKDATGFDKTVQSEMGDVTIRQAGELFPAGKSPYILERLTRGVFGKGQQFLKYGPFDPETYKTIGKSYEDILAPVKDDLNGFRAYMVAKRALEVEGQGKTSGFDSVAAQKVVDAGAKQYEPVFQERLKYRDSLLNYMQKSGVLSEDAVSAMKEANKDYVPFYRFFEDQSRSNSARKVYNPIKGLKGSERPIIDPIQSDIKDTFLFIALSEKNMARQAFVNNLGEDFAERVPGKVKPITLTDTEIQSFGGDTETATIFRGMTQPLEKDQIAVFQEGKRQVYQVNADVAEAFNGSDKISSGFLSNMLRTPASLLRAGTVISPDFAIRNAVRDALTGFVYAGSNPIKTAKGAISLLKEDNAYQNWLKGGGANATMVSMDRDYINNELFKLDSETKLSTRAWNVLTKPVDILRATSEFIENSTRLGTARDELGIAKDKATIQALSYLTRESTVDFSVKGASPTFQKYTGMTAFMNPGIQGIDRLYREFKTNPAGIMAKSLVAITIPSLLLWWKNNDDPRYQEIPQWQKDLFWVVLTKDNIYRVPKPYEVGVLFGSLPERLMDTFVKDNPHGLRDIDKTLTQAFGVNTVPTFISPIVEQFSNRSLFTGNPIIPSDLEKLMPEYQYTEYTTEAAKAIGSLIGAFPGMRKLGVSEHIGSGVAQAITSPVLIENYLRAWTGGLGRYILQVSDYGLKKAGVLPDPVLPAETLADIPFIKAFIVRYPTTGTQSIQDFFDTYQQKEKVLNTFNFLIKEGNITEAQHVLKFDPSAIADLTAMRMVLTEQSRVIRNIYKNPQMTPEEKRQQIDTLYGTMINIAHAGNEMFRQIESSLELQKRLTPKE